MYSILSSANINRSRKRWVAEFSFTKKKVVIMINNINIKAGRLFCCLHCDTFSLSFIKKEKKRKQ